MSNQGKKVLLFLSSSVLLLLPVMVLATSCQPIDQSDIINNLLPNLWVFLTHAFASVFLITIIIWLVWKPTKDALAKRRDYIANEIKEAEKARNEAFVKLKEAEQEKINAYAQAQVIVDNAQARAYQQQTVIISEGKNTAQKIMDDAKRDAIQLEIRLKNDNQKQIMDIAFTAAEALVKKNFDEADNKKMVQDFIDHLEKGEKQ